MSTVQLNNYRWLKLIGMFALAVSLTGCVSPQPTPSDDQSVVSDISPNQVRESGTTGATVRWGGTITAINNLADGKTAIELVSRPLHTGGRPIHNDTSNGRFIAETTDFLDPEIVKAGRDFTLVGTVTGLREGKIGEAEYTFPVVEIDNYRYWRKQTTVPPGYYRYWNGYSPYRYDPFFHDWPYRPHRRYRKSGVNASFLFIQR